MINGVPQEIDLAKLTDTNVEVHQDTNTDTIVDANEMSNIVFVLESVAWSVLTIVHWEHRTGKGQVHVALSNSVRKKDFVRADAIRLCDGESDRNMQRCTRARALMHGCARAHGHPRAHTQAGAQAHV